MMKKKQTTKTVEFSNLTEEHKAEFIQFLIKNNICFQEGKENCTAKVSIKQPKVASQRPLQQKNMQVRPQRKEKSQQSHPIIKKYNKELQIRPEVMGKKNMPQIMNRQIKTPTKDRKSQLRDSSPSCNGKGNKTVNSFANQTPKSVRPKTKTITTANQVSEYEARTKSASKILIETENMQKSKIERSREKLEASRERILVASRERESVERHQIKGPRKTQISRERVVNKYANLFDLGDKGRAIKWPISLLERTIQQIYDDIFTRNTQCLQNKNIGTALKALTLTTFSQLIEGYFRKKFKGSKLAATNLNNMLYSLSYYISREACPIFVKTFEDFLLEQLQHQDLLYYLFARNILKKQLRVHEKLRDTSKTIEGSYFVQGLRAKDIIRYLRGIIGRDSQLLNQYKQLVFTNMINEQINAYQFLRILLQDYHIKRLCNKTKEFENGDSFGNQLFQKDYSYDRKNTDELTFGEEPDGEEEEETKQIDFWQCHAESRIKDSLYDLIMEKMQKKTVQLIDILVNDMEKHPEELSCLSQLLLKKSGCLVKAVFEMNKMKWFKQLNIPDPSEEDMNFAEGLQMRLRELRENPSGKQIGQFCKNILTTKALINQLQLALMND